MIGYIALAITAIIIVSVCAKIDNWQRDWTTSFAETDPAAADPEVHPLTLPQTPTEVADMIRNWAKKQADWGVIAEENKSGLIQMHLNRTTLVMRFVDDINVTLEPNDQGTIVNATSQSRVGKGDLGQNPRNLKKLLGAIRPQ